MSNCVVGSGGLRLPCSIIAEHSVEGCDHFSHDGDDDDLERNLRRTQTKLVVGLSLGTAACALARRHVWKGAHNTQ
jgi:hypothetical protein